MGVAFAALAAMVLAAILAWHTPGVRRSALARLAARAAQEGVTVSADDLAIHPSRGVVEVLDLAVGAPGAAPFLTVRRLTVEVDLAALLRREVVLRQVSLHSPHLDLAAPLPPLPPSAPGRSAPSPPQIAVERLLVADGSLTGGTIPESLHRWLEGFRVTHLSGEGSYRDGTLRASLTAKEVVLARPAAPATTVAVAVAGEARVGGRWTVARCSARGDGVLLELSGTGELDGRGAQRASFELHLQPARVAPELGVGGELALAGEVAAWPLRGNVRLAASGVTAGAALRTVAPDLVERLALADATFDLTAASSFELPDNADPPRGQLSGKASLRRGGVLLADATLAARGEGGRGSADFQISLLPGEAGRRDLRGTLVLPTLADLGAAYWQAASFELEEADVAAALDTLARHWPIVATLPLPTGVRRGALALHAAMDGPLLDPTVRGHLRWQPAPGELVEGRLWGRPGGREGEGDLLVHAAALAPFLPGWDGTISAALHLAGSPRGVSASFRLDGAALGRGEMRLDGVHLEGLTDGRELRLSHLAARQGERRVEGTARIDLALPLREAEAALRLRDLAPGLSEVEMAAHLHEGTLQLEVPRADTALGTLWLAADLPLGFVRSLLGEEAASWPILSAEGPMLLRAALPHLDTCALAPFLPVLDRPERGEAGLELALLLDPSDPTAAMGELRLRDLTVESNGTRLVETPAVRALLADRRLFLPPVALRAAETRVEAGGEARLRAAFSPGREPWTSAVTSFEAQARGSVDAALLQPALAGATATGPVSFAVRLSGTPAHPQVAASLDAAEASFLWLTPYAARLEQVRASAALTGDGDVLFDALGTLNGGPVRVIGSRSASGYTEAQVELAGSRFRLDFGVLVQVAGELLADLPPEGRSRIHGALEVRRGRLDRPISLRHELLPFLLAPKTGSGTLGGTLDLVDLDVAVRTEEGIRVRNNLADLRVRWDELLLRGTAWNPHLEGEVYVDPGGVVRAWGQTLRLDRAVATFTGDPNTDPRLELAITSSLDDPSVGRGGRMPPALLGEEARPTGATLDAKVAAAAAGALGSTVASSLAPSLGEATRIVVEPVLVFGEADPSARLTVARDVSSAVAFAVSVDLRRADRQTYLVDIHDLPRLPTFTAQIFTNDEGNSGLTLQQVLEWGGSRRARSAPLSLQRLRLEAPPELPHRRLLSRGDPLLDGVELEVELELEQALRDLGYPDADVAVRVQPVSGRRRRADLIARVEPGAPVVVAFAGEAPPLGARPLITSLYRSGLWEDEAMEEMRRAAVRVWRSLGHPAPEVEVQVTPARQDRPRTVTVTSLPGRRLEPLPRLEVEGVPDDVEARLAAAFAGSVELMELAAGLAETDRRFLETMATLGYPRARLLGRRLEGDGRSLSLQVDPGQRERFAEVRIVGVPAAELPELSGLVGMAAGAPARRDEAAAAAVRLAEWYRTRGHPDVQVRPVVRHDPDDPWALSLTFEVTPGPAFRLTGIELAGAPRTATSVATRIAGLTARQPLRLDLVREGRRRLLATGLYDGVDAEVAREADGNATIRFHLEERPPISLAYGVRWESSKGTSAVVDYLDRNLLGRTLTFGARAIYDATTRAARLYLGAGDVLGTNLRSEAFLEQRRRITQGDTFLPDLIEDTTRFTFQLSRPLGEGWLARGYGRWQRTHLFERTDFFPLDLTLTLPYLGLGLAYDSRDDQVLASRGLLATLDLSGTGKALGADLTFLRAFGQVASFLPAGQLAGRPLSWAQSVRVGLATTGRGEELIRSERFFAGGEYSVRGYPSESLGPVEDLGFATRPAGGAALLVVNEELRLRLPFDLTGLLFLDAGQVWERAATVRWRELALAAGVGVRAATPIGVLRLDAAIPLDRRPTDPRVAFYVGLGSVF